MAQELDDLRSQVKQQEVVMSSLTDQIGRINEILSYTAGTSNAETNPLVRLEFFHDKTKPLIAAHHSDQLRGQVL